MTANVVVFETDALILNRTGGARSKAIEFLDGLKVAARKVERVTEYDEDAAFDLVRQHKDKTYSLCDALGFVVCERLDITDAIAFDADVRSYRMGA